VPEQLRQARAELAAARLGRQQQELVFALLPGDELQLDEASDQPLSIGRRLRGCVDLEDEELGIGQRLDERARRAALDDLHHRSVQRS
jgi:hypothetical protein